MRKQLKEENNTSIPMLEESFKKLWEKMGDYEYLESMVSSMPRMMADMIEKDRSMTKY